MLFPRSSPLVGVLFYLSLLPAAVLAEDSSAFTVAPHDVGAVRLIAYGDQRFTDVSEKEASRPGPRQALVRRIAEEPADAVLMTGDVPWHGGTVNDYAVYLKETAALRDRQLPIFPALGNHEFSGCAESECLAHWWDANPSLRGRRYYAVDFGTVRALALDSALPFNAGSAQRLWLESEFRHLPSGTQFVVLFLHHPPLAAVESDPLRHNVRPSEVVLADYLSETAETLTARLLVVAGHVHNYERHEQGGITYLVSGGGGAKPYPVSREGDHYTAPGEPNFHYLTLTAANHRLTVEMHRLEDPDAVTPHEFAVRDRFEILASAPASKAR
jgi:3',5'-cyclic AMP phosphodiesterase CpdA